MTCTHAATTSGLCVARSETDRGSIRGLLARWGERRRQRRALAELDDRLLRDIGLAPQIAVHEASKPFWR